MISEIQEILSKDVKEVISSPLSLKLLKIYSTLYLGGAQPRWCEKSQTSYYNQLAVNGLQKAKTMSEILERTCQIKEDSCVFITDLQQHITNGNITDWIACEGLTKGWFKESLFIKLPDCWLNKDEPKSKSKTETETEAEAEAETETETETETTKKRVYNKRK